MTKQNKNLDLFLKMKVWLLMISILMDSVPNDSLGNILNSLSSSPSLYPHTLPTATPFSIRVLSLYDKR